MSGVLVCTDRGQHRAVVLGRWAVDDHGDPVLLDPEDGHVVPPDEVAEALYPDDVQPGLSTRSYRIGCPRCRRDLRLRARRWLALITAAEAAGMAEFDVSGIS